MIKVVFSDPAELVVEGDPNCTNRATDLFRRQHCSLGVRLEIVNNPEQKS